METQTNAKVTRYKPNQIGYLSQELVKTIRRARPEATETEIKLIDEVATIISTSYYGVSSAGIEYLTSLLKRYQNEVKESKIVKLESELAKLKEVSQ